MVFPQGVREFPWLVRVKNRDKRSSQRQRNIRGEDTERERERERESARKTGRKAAGYSRPSALICLSSYQVDSR